MGGTAPGWHPDPSGRWQLRWWDGAAWTDRVATSGRVGTDPVPGGDATADAVNRVLATALGYADLANDLRDPLTDEAVTAALWRAAQNRRDVVLLASGHLRSLEREGTERARAEALVWLERALAQPPPMTG